MSPRNNVAALCAAARRVVTAWEAMQESAGLTLGTPLDAAPMREAVEHMRKCERAVWRDGIVPPAVGAHLR